MTNKGNGSSVWILSWYDIYNELIMFGLLFHLDLKSETTKSLELQFWTVQNLALHPDKKVLYLGCGAVLELLSKFY